MLARGLDAHRLDRPCAFTVQRDGEDVASAPLHPGESAHAVARDACAIVEYLAEFIGAGEYRLVFDFPGRTANGEACILHRMAMVANATVTSGPRASP
jgi:hypothetical protein